MPLLSDAKATLSRKGRGFTSPLDNQNIFLLSYPRHPPQPAMACRQPRRMTLMQWYIAKAGQIRKAASAEAMHHAEQPGFLPEPRTVLPKPPPLSQPVRCGRTVETPAMLPPAARPRSASIRGQTCASRNHPRNLLGYPRHMPLETQRLAAVFCGRVGGCRQHGYARCHSGV